MRKPITILVLISFLIIAAKPRPSNGYTSKVTFYVGEEIFRRDATSASGWEYKNEAGTWGDAPFWDDATHADGIGEINNSSSTQTIEGFVFKNTGSTNGDHCLRMSNVSNKTIKRNLFLQSLGLAIYLYGGSHDVVIKNNFIAYCERGILVEACTDDVDVFANQFLNIVWNRTAGGTIAGQLIQVSISDGPGFKVRSNKAENYFGESENEDLINCYGSSGTVGSPLDIRGNIFRGGGWSRSGGGILAGDISGGHTNVDSNILYNPGNYGFHFPCGHDMAWTNNKVYHAQKPFSGNGFVLGYGSCTPGTCINITMGSGNYSDFTNYSGSAANFISNPGVCTAPGGGSVGGPNTGTSLSGMLSGRLLDYISEDDEWYLRSLKMQYAQLVIDGDTDAFSPYAYSTGFNVRRPTSSFSISGSGSTQTLTSTSTADNSAGGNGTNTLTGYTWTIISGSGTITSPTASSTTITGLSGTTEVRLITEQTNGQSGLLTFHSAWDELTATTSIRKKGRMFF